jgi:hypothetical protein
LELTSYGLTALTAMMVVAFCFAYGDELPRTREEFSCDLISAAHLNDSMMIESGREAGDIRGMFVNNKELSQHTYCRKHRGLRQATAQST